MQETAMAENEAVDQKAEVHFLVDNFGIAPNRAAEVIAGEGDAAEQLGAEVAAEDRDKDPLERVYVPDPNKGPEHVEKEIEERSER
ncbi:hypothetical protein WH91_07170 [Devosia psychrophila]|uniref:Uncharacterized protein n=2 Tax=Devosia psychrophila TaxID=728005 RepID=A0ABR5E0F0_9HYPH|nr:hypothetical protein WH91_07170 [Devosia psychrophila]